MSPSHADDAPHGPSDSDAAKAQGTATSSEVVAKPPPTLQNRRVLVISDANQGASSGTDTATSSQTAAENGGEYGERVQLRLSDILSTLNLCIQQSCRDYKA